MTYRVRGEWWQWACTVVFGTALPIWMLMNLMIGEGLIVAIGVCGFVGCCLYVIYSRQSFTIHSWGVGFDLPSHGFPLRWDEME
jgi:hypothetical protein